MQKAGWEESQSPGFLPLRLQEGERILRGGKGARTLEVRGGLLWGQAQLLEIAGLVAPAPCIEQADWHF